MESKFFAARALRNYFIFIQRFGTSFWTNNGQNILGLENNATNRVEKVRLLI